MNVRDRHIDTSLIRVHDGECYLCRRPARVQVGAKGIVYCDSCYVPQFIGRLVLCQTMERFGKAVA